MEDQNAAEIDPEAAARRALLALPSFVSRLSPISFVGDSNVLVHRNALYRDVPTFVQPVVTQAIYCEQIRAQTFTTPEGALNPAVLYPLLGSLALLGDPEDWGSERRADVVRRHQADLERFGERWVPDFDETFWRPVVVFHVGNLDFRGALLELGNDCDFSFESPRFDETAFARRAATAAVPAALVRSLVRRMFEPFFRGLVALRDAGLTHIAVHDLQPPNPSDELFSIQLGGALFAAALRYKLTLAINESLERFCAEERLHFLDIWDRVTVRGLLDERFVLDESHLNAAAARLSVERLGELLAAT